MDFNLKQWRNQQYESEEQHHSSKIPKLRSNTNPHETQYQKPELQSEPALPLFVPEQQQQQQQSPNKLTNHLSAATQPFPHQSTPPPSSRPPRMGSNGGYFSMAQWQELELQALIFRYMVAGAAVPAELLQPIRKSLSNLIINTTHYNFLHQQPYYPHYQQPAWYWGRAAMDPEPGRCRRTDGKKWRCSRDVVVGHKYCERHMHRGKNRSRKPVETPTLTGAGNSPSSPPLAASGCGTHFALSGKMPSNNTSAGPTTTTTTTSTSVDLLRLSRSSSDVKCENKHAFEPNINVSGEAKSDGHVLRHFFDDWPRSRKEPEDAMTATSERNSATSLSISMVGNPSSDVSLKLSPGDGPAGDPGTRALSERQLGWAVGWGSSPMGGPLAEALRSSSNSNSNSSPTSVLHQLPRGSASDFKTLF